MSEQEPDPDARIDAMEKRLDAMSQKLHLAVQRIEELEESLQFQTAALDAGDHYDQKAIAILVEEFGDEEFGKEDIGEAYREVGVRDRSKIRERVNDFTSRFCEHDGWGNFALEIEGLGE